ncbi:uncharacterized protein IUM83_06300 [Phytophthora cinnamomi]|uniref:uncharacterized protein n=1 Tax=Phytophthora cinnamomi TaxID=4785 RepID=UPI00355A162D|nr:hypothetical protein IUM83_06300 [Phytophthora cinnamomi]
MSRQEAGGDALRARAIAARDPGQQPLGDANTNAQGNYAPHDDQMRAPAASQTLTGGTSLAQPNRNGGDRNWSARIRASIARLMEIDGLCLGPESYAKAVEKRKAREEEQAFHERVDKLEAASKTAHEEYCTRLRDVYSASTAKKMRLTSSESPPPTVTTSASSASWQRRNEHAALDALAVAAATEQLNPNEPAPPAGLAAAQAKKPKRGSRRHNALPLDEEGAGTARNPVLVHDPALSNAVDKLACKLAQLLDQLQATSDAAAAEPLLAAAATIALEATEMRRREEVALTRMVEIKEYRQQIMQGLLEYAKRKEQREVDEAESNKGAKGADDQQS